MRVAALILGAGAALGVPGPGRAQVPETDPEPEAGAHPDAPADALAGRWEGAISVPGQELGIAVTFASSEEGLEARIDIPAQGASGVPLREVSFDPPAVRFELPAGPGLAVWEGELAGNRIEGRFTQGGAEGTFHLERAGRADGAGDEEEEPPPYRQEEVGFGHGDVRLAGTLTLPEGPGPFPAIVLISGSGPQDRDETLFGFRPFRRIADHLTRAGIAVLRYDDRGVGGSTGDVSSATSADFADDALAAVELLASRQEIDSRAIGLLGHSEGGIVAPIAANRSARVAFLVLLAPTAVPGSEVVLAQSRAIASANGTSELEIARQEAFQRRLLDAIREGRSLEEARAELELMIRDGVRSLPADRRAAIEDPEAFAADQAGRQLRSLGSPWFRHFLDYDPAPALRRLDVPVLALFGARDLQVLPEQNRPPLHAALAEAPVRDVTVETVPEANHLFQAARTGSPSEYATLEKEFVPGLLERIAGWTLSRVRAR